MSASEKAQKRKMLRKLAAEWEKAPGWLPLVALDRGKLMAEAGFIPEGQLGFWKNHLYTVQRYERQSEWGVITLLMVRRNDEKPIRSWSDMQRVKNELMGPERIAVEVYPRESELVDVANIYHLWVLPEGMKLPFGLHLPASVKGTT